MDGDGGWCRASVKGLTVRSGSSQATRLLLMVAAFGVLCRSERAVAVCELRPAWMQSRSEDLGAALTALRRALREESLRTHGLELHDVRFVRAGTLPKTSSGKLRRFRCKQRYLGDDGGLVEAHDGEGPGGSGLLAAARAAWKPGEWGWQKPAFAPAATFVLLALALDALALAWVRRFPEEA